MCLLCTRQNQYHIQYLIIFVVASQHIATGSVSQDREVAAFCLLLPGKMLYISALLAAKRFRYKGNKGVVKAIKMLEEAGIGRVIEDKPPRGATIVSSIY